MTQTYPQHHAPDWIETYTGRALQPAFPDQRAICIEDIAHSLSLQCRFVGHCRRFYSVGLHSLFVYVLVKTQTDCIETQKYALLHEGSEAILHDINRPLKVAPVMDGYRGLEKCWQKEIAAALNIDMRGVDLQLVKEADNQALRQEARALMPSLGKGWELPETRPFPPVMVGMPHLSMSMEAVEAMILRIWQKLNHEG